MRLDLRHVVEDARTCRAEDGGIEPAEMVRRDDDAAVERDALLAVDPEPGEGGGGRADRRPPDCPRDVDGVHRAAPRARRSARRPRPGSARSCRPRRIRRSMGVHRVALVAAPELVGQLRHLDAFSLCLTSVAREPRDRRRARSSPPRRGRRPRRCRVPRSRSRPNARARVGAGASPHGPPGDGRRRARRRRSPARGSSS